MDSTARQAPSVGRFDPAQQLPVAVRDVEYRRDGDAPLLVRLYEPEGAGPFPLLLDVHGGAWNSNDRTANEPMARALASSGLVVAAVDFRQAPAYQYPTALQDIHYAIRWLKAHAAEFRADARRMGALGTSSGGHLALLTAMRPSDPRYAALPLPEAPTVDARLAYVIACWPIVDPYARYEFARETNRSDLMARSEAFFGSFDAMREGNPQGLLDRGEPVELPPVLVIQGTNDNNISVAIVQRFVDSYRAAGGDIALELFEGQPHGFGNQATEAAQRAIARMKAFIARQLAPAPTPAG
jgi:acetyl esterase/lipase